MKKIYSFVLMAAMLLVGTSAWAQLNVATVTGAGAGNYKSLQEAVNAIPAGQTATITLLRNVTLSAPVVIPQVTGDVTEAQKVVNREMQHITLDLGEFNISASQSYYGSAFILLKGELNIVGNGTISRNDAESATWAGSWGNFSKSTIVVCGADGNKTTSASDRSKQEWSILTIGKDVTIEGKGHKADGTEGGFGVCIQNFNESNFKDKISAIQFANLGYQTIYTTAENNANGKLWWDNGSNAGCAFGVKVIVKGTISAYQRGINIVGTVNQSAKAVENATKRTKTEYPFYEHNYPYIVIEKGAVVECEADGLESGNGGIYGGGWAVIDIYGSVKGQTGVFLKGGDVVVDGGLVQSTSTAQAAGTSANYGGNVSGNAIFIASAANYSGATNVAVEGGATIDAGVAGAAIVDKVATDANATAPTVQHVEIIEGTLEGGTLGGIVATTGTASNTTILDATIENGITINGEPATTVQIANMMVPGSTNVPGSSQQDLSGESDFVITVPTNTTNIIVEPNTAKNVTMNANGWASYSFESNPVAYRQIPAGLTAYIGTVVDGTELTLVKVTSTIPSGKGVLLHGTENTKYSLNLSETVSSFDFNANLLKPASAFDADKDDSKNIYILHGEEIWLYTGDEFKDNKAYLPFDGAATPAGAPARIKMVIAETQDVENVEVEAVKAVKFIENGQVLIKRGEKVYNVQGQIVK